MTDTATPIQLLALTPDQAEAENKLSGQFSPFALSVGKARVLAELGGPTTPSLTDPWLLFTLDGANAAIQIPETVMARCIGQAVDHRVPNDIALLLEDALADWLDLAEATHLPTVRFQTTTTTTPSLSMSRRLNLRAQTTDGQFLQYSLPLALSNVAARCLASALAEKKERRNPPSSLSVLADIRLAGPEIFPSALSRLRPGDGIRLPLGLDTPTPCTLIIGTYAAALSPDPGGYRLAAALHPLRQGEFSVDQTTDIQPETEAPPSTETLPSTETPEPETDSESIDIETLPLRLSFKIGEASLSVAEVSTLGAGSLIPVPGGPEATLEILANGRKIGLGELVAIGETRAVRVLSLD